LRTMRLYSAHSHSVCFVFLSPHPSAPSSLFPYTTLFRSCGPDDKIIDPIITAQAADTALDLENVGASFAITRRSDNTIGISARSMGKINVQIIMEKLGGGGHLSNAATQIKDVTIEEAKQKLLDAIDEYEKEND